ncbi:MAG: hypothetical protein ACTHM6_12265 [Tepidisphaeraceae bacterium]
MRQWDDIARDCRKAANELVATRYRSCLSRAYYAAYSKVTHLLVAKGVPMPPDREGPNHPGHLPTGNAAHNGIRRLIVTHLTQFDDLKRRKLSELVGELYTLRLYADYRPSIDIGASDAREAVSMMNTIFEAF